MRFDVLTLFPELFAPQLTVGITRRAFEKGQVDVCLSNPRDFAQGNYRRVDDRPFGGGPGMVMMAEPLTRCLQHVRTQRGDTARGRAIAITRYECPTCSEDYDDEEDAEGCCGEDDVGDNGCPVCAEKCNDTRDASDCCLWKDIDAPTRWRMADAVDAGSTWAEQLAAHTVRPSASSP